MSKLDNLEKETSCLEKVDYDPKLQVLSKISKRQGKASGDYRNSKKRNIKEIESL